MTIAIGRNSSWLLKLLVNDGQVDCIVEISMVTGT